MDVDYLLNYPGEHEESLEILTDEEIIDNVTKINQEDEVEDNSFVMEFVFRKEAIKIITTLNNFIL